MTTISYAFAGDLLSTNAAAAQTDVFAQLDRATGWSLVDLDLSSARMVDSVGLNLLVSVIRAAQRRGGRVRIVVRENSVRRIMAFTRIDQHAEVVVR